MRQPTDTKTIDGPITSLGTYIDLELELSDVLGDRLRRTSTGDGGAVCRAPPAELHAALDRIASSAGRAQTRRLARTLVLRLEEALRDHPGTESVAMTLHRLNGQ